MNEMHAKLLYWTGTNTGLGEQETSICGEQPGQQSEGQSASQSCCSETRPTLPRTRRRGCAEGRVTGTVTVSSVSGGCSPRASGRPHCSLTSEGRYWLCSRAGTVVTEHFWLPPKDQPESTTTGSPELSIPTAFSSLKSCDTAWGCHSPTEWVAPALSISALRFALAEKSLQSRNYHQSSD